MQRHVSCHESTIIIIDGAMSACQNLYLLVIIKNLSGILILLNYNQDYHHAIIKERKINKKITLLCPFMYANVNVKWKIIMRRKRIIIMRHHVIILLLCAQYYYVRRNPVSSLLLLFSSSSSIDIYHSR